MGVVTGPQKASERVVVLLRPSERKRLQTLARNEQVSSAEILRRSLELYETFNGLQEEGLIEKLNEALDKALASSAEARRSIELNLQRIAQNRLDPKVDARLEELYQEALAQNGARPTDNKARRQKTA